MLREKNVIIQIIFGSLIGISPWIIINKMGNDPSMNSPLDPEGIMVLILFVEVIYFIIWLCWLIYSLNLYKKNKISLLVIGITNLPYIIFYGYGELSLVNILLIPLTMFIHNKLCTNTQLYKVWIEIEVLLLISLNIIAWFLLLFIIYKRKMKKELGAKLL